MTAIVTVTGASDAGKTTFIEQVVPVLRARGLAVGTVKHAPHGFQADRPGSDSARHAAAGASPVLLAGSDGQVIFTSTPAVEPAPHADSGHRAPAAGAAQATQVTEATEVTEAAEAEERAIDTAIARYFAGTDLVLVEGLARRPGAKVLVHRRGVVPREAPPGTTWLFVVTDEPQGRDRELAPGDVEAAADLLAAHVAEWAEATGAAGARVELEVDGRPVEVDAARAANLAALVSAALGDVITQPPQEIEVRVKLA